MKDVPASDGQVEARYLAFLETITQLRPSLHRYCARMTGSVLEGEDVVQETLFQAYRKLETFDDTRPLAPWLFRIAHNRCIDFLRRRRIREQAEVAAADGQEPSTPPIEPVGPALGKAVEHLVVMLPPKERACVLLKDVFDYSLKEIADLVDSTVGGVKAALNRGRSVGSQTPSRVCISPMAELLASRITGTARGCFQPPRPSASTTSPYPRGARHRSSSKRFDPGEIPCCWKTRLP
jgi:RNA polymerase sigma-70 factor (ECF subfamily)